MIFEKFRIAPFNVKIIMQHPSNVNRVNDRMQNRTLTENAVLRSSGQNVCISIPTRHHAKIENNFEKSIDKVNVMCYNMTC